MHEWYSRSRGLKAFVASGLLIVCGWALLPIIYWLDESRRTTFNNSLATQVLKPKVRLFDVILLNDELDTLEIRLNELQSVVDVFLSWRPSTPFQGSPNLSISLKTRRASAVPRQNRLYNHSAPFTGRRGTLQKRGKVGQRGVCTQ